MILKGSKISQANRNKKKKMMANGQHSTNKILQSKTAMMNFMIFVFVVVINNHAFILKFYNSVTYENSMSLSVLKKNRSMYLYGQ